MSGKHGRVARVKSAARIKVMREVRIRAYTIVEDAVARAVAYGWQRAHKYVDNPEKNAILAALEDAVMAELSEIIEWQEGGGEGA